MIDWQAVRSVLLDMDGTLLDLHYDTHFWLSHVPQRYAEKHGVALERAQGELAGRYRKVAGTMQWYSIDYWSRELELDIAQLKEEVRHLIAVHPHVVEFLAALRQAGKRVVLVTNAHHKSLALKLSHTGLGDRFDRVVCAHDLTVPKEDPSFWGRLQGVESFDPAATLLVDDSLPVLRSARGYGIAHLLAVRRPDSHQPVKEVTEFPAIDSFAAVMPRLPAR